MRHVLPQPFQQKPEIEIGLSRKSLWKSLPGNEVKAHDIHRRPLEFLRRLYHRKDCQFDPKRTVRGWNERRVSHSQTSAGRKQAGKRAQLQTCCYPSRKRKNDHQARAAGPESRVLIHRGLLPGLESSWSLPSWIVKLPGTSDSLFSPSVCPCSNGNACTAALCLPNHRILWASPLLSRSTHSLMESNSALGWIRPRASFIPNLDYFGNTFRDFWADEIWLILEIGLML